MSPKAPPSPSQFVPVRPSSSQSAMLPLLLAALGAPGAAPFVLQVASWCSLAADGSLVATNGSQEVLVALSQMPLVCGDLRGPRAGPCLPGGPLGILGDRLARALDGDSRWGQRLRQRRRLCQELPGRVWPPLRAPPQLRIVPERSGPALALACHAWGFSPAEITLRWLRNGDIVGDTVGDVVGDTSPPQLRIVPERSGPALALACHAWGFSPAEITLRWLRNRDIVGDIVRDMLRIVPERSGPALALACHAWGFCPAEITLRWLPASTLPLNVPFCPQMSPPAPPQLRIVPERSGPALALACHAWGFSPAEITLRWLRNGDIVGDTVGDTVGDNVGDTSGQPRALPVGDGTFWARVSIQVPPGTSGDTFECLALHPSLEEPLRVTWAPGLSPRLSLLVALAVLALLLGLLLFTFGLSRYLGSGHFPFPGDTHAGERPNFTFLVIFCLFFSFFYPFKIIFLLFPPLSVPFLSFFVLFCPFFPIFCPLFFI
ncbi:HLA class II histocompatibility antigen, DM beta chain-like, partial [Haemorhous mexicanus]|uniref:HLA class II histocompatibility antigen, DM beta chain-like n=1 Tax=Haemorhous mexicanus TaxID=30427 RepID=UPI0028BECD51